MPVVDVTAAWVLIGPETKASPLVVIFHQPAVLNVSCRATEETAHWSWSAAPRATGKFRKASKSRKTPAAAPEREPKQVLVELYLTILSRDTLEVGGVAAIVDQDKCVGCLTCVRVCPFDVPVVMSDRTGVGGIQGAAYIEAGRCQGCGTCTGECPAKAIQLTLYRDEQIIVPELAVLGAWLPNESEE